MAALGHIDYPQDNIKINNRVVPMRLQREGGCANLAAIHNMLRIKGYRQWETTVRSEHLIMRDLKDKLEEIILSMKDIPPAEADEAKKTLANVRTLFCLKPCLTGHLEFEKNGSRLLCELLNLPVLHAWVLDPQEESYDVFCHYSHSDLADYCIEDIGDHLDVCQRLLAKNFTSFGFKTLLEELNDDSGTALLFRGNRLDVICKHDSAIFIYVVEQTIREKIKGAVWMLFEEDEEQRIYFTDKFTPVKVQPHREKAMKWYGDLLKKPKDIEDEKRKKSSQHMLSDAAAGSSIPGEATGKRADAVGSHHGDGGAVVSRQDRVKKSPQQAHTVSAQSSESSTEILTTGKGAEAVGSHHGDGGPVVSHQDRVKKSPQQAHTVAAQSPSTEILTTGKGAEAVGSHQGDGGEVTQSDDAGGSSSPSEASGKRAEAVDPHQGHGEVVVFPEDNTVKKPPQQAHSADGAAETSKSTTAEEDRRPEADNISGSQDHVLKGDASDFLNFLDEFKDNGCSDHYFKGVVAAFASQRPMFYVPFDFIMSFNEPLALKIEHNYSGICEDLKKAVDIYLTKNGVESPDAILKILGRPQAKSVQLFVDFVESIVLHEHYSISDEHPQSLPSHDSRSMALGYLSSIVSKFKTGRCWDGKWTEADMKVRNGTEFFIDLKEDFELTPDRGHRDLVRFCETVVERLKIEGKFLPYFDELAEDHMLINDCFEDPEKWQRFLQLISYPLAFKPPLVRASFICNIYIVGDANSSGAPPQYRPLHVRKNCINWRRLVTKHKLLLKVYNYPHDEETRKYKHISDHWSPTHWHLFKFSRHFIQHALGYTKGKDSIQKMEDISVLDILLSRTISKAIAKSVRFLVLQCGVSGLFSSPWRHYIGSDYIDKPNLEDGVVQGLLHSIEQNKSGYVYSEISLYSEPQYLSIITHNADLAELQIFLNGINFACEHNGDHLQYGPVKLRKRIRAATEECPEHGVIVVEGPFCTEYDNICDVLLASENLPPTL